jgi:hypothetical protein|tara:strand:+ start:505 stop:822 length:318 start_codon:yes stop_codon:yes gene_type:complete
MELYVLFAVSVILNVLLLWYITRLLRKFVFISENLADLFLTTKAFQVFIKSMYSMENYHGEPMIQELMQRVGDVVEEIDNFREIFEYSLDAELEDELNATAEEEN